MREEVLEFMNHRIDDNISDIELLDYLGKYRNSLHPDKHKGLEEIYNYKFSKAHDLFENFKEFINQDKQELMKVFKDDAIVSRDNKAVFEIIKLEDENNNLKELNETYRERIKEMEADQKKKEEEEVINTIKEQKSFFRNSKTEYAKLTTTLGVSVLIAMAGQVSALSDLLVDIFPFDIKILNGVLFFCFLAYALKILLKNVISHEIELLFDSILTRQLRFSFLKDKDIIHNYIFNEMDIMIFLKGYIEKNYKMLNLLVLKTPFFKRGDILLDKCTEIFIKKIIEENIIVCKTIDRPVRTYSLKHINYDFEWEYIKDLDII